jgi:AcrR family transcriptional regulator
MTAKERHRQEAAAAVRSVRRRAAVETATDLFASQGFHATAMADVAQGSGVSLKALYEAFPSKEALFSAVLIDVGERFATLFVEREAGPSPADDLIDLVERVD